MNAVSSTILAYVVITVLLWVYAGHLFLAYRRALQASASKPCK